MKKIIVMLLALVALCGCQKEEFEGFDMPFVKVTTTTGASQTVVLSNVNNINTYVVSVSSKMLTTALVVNYEIVVGDGLRKVSTTNSSPPATSSPSSPASTTCPSASSGLPIPSMRPRTIPSPSVSPATARTCSWVFPVPMVSRNNL